MQVDPAEYWAATPDPVAQFSKPVCGHMNADHADAIVAMVKNAVNIDVSEAKMLSLDRLGVNTACMIGDITVNVRLAFPEPAEDRKSIKERIVAMTKAGNTASTA
jgi:putative heme iron utilization protein